MDRGISWDYVGTVVSDYMNGDGSASIAADSVGNLYVLLWDDYTDLRLYVSTNGGSSWTYRSTVAPGNADICACGTELVALDAMPLSFQEDSGVPPMEIFVNGNKVSLSLSSSGHYSLVVYDPAGRKIRDLWNGSLAAGSHSFRLDALDKGVYLLRFYGEGLSSTVRFVQ
ncbi:MAG: T9SS type A sorting domain-containing protein [candidate division WOR-3 bacterium]